MPNWNQIDEDVFDVSFNKTKKKSLKKITSLENFFKDNVIPEAMNNKKIKDYDILETNHWIRHDKKKHIWDVGALWTMANSLTDSILQIKTPAGMLFRLTPAEIESNKIITFQKLESQKWLIDEKEQDHGIQVTNILDILPHFNNPVLTSQCLDELECKSFYLCSNQACSLLLLTPSKDMLNINLEDPTDPESFIVYRNIIHRLLSFLGIKYDWESSVILLDNKMFDKSLPFQALLKSIQRNMYKLYPNFVRKVTTILLGYFIEPKQSSMKTNKETLNTIKRICSSLAFTPLSLLQSNQSLLLQLMIICMLYRYPNINFYYWKHINLNEDEQSDLLYNLPNESQPIIITFEKQPKQKWLSSIFGLFFIKKKDEKFSIAYYEPTHDIEIFDLVASRFKNLKFKNKTPQGFKQNDTTGIIFCLFVALQRIKNARFPIKDELEFYTKASAKMWLRIYQSQITAQLQPYLKQIMISDLPLPYSPQFKP